MELSIVIPCYNEGEVIQETNSRLTTILSDLVSHELISKYEILYVDDGSNDNTLDCLKQLITSDKNMKVISLSGNFGHQSALAAGLNYASGDAVISMDADLQDPPEILEEMLDKFKEGYDIVYGVRKSRENDSFFKRTTAGLFYNLMKAMGVNMISNHADFRLLSRRVLNEFKKYTEVNKFLRGLFPIIGFNQCVIEYEREKRFAGRTKYPLKKMISFAVEGVTSFSYFPLRIAAISGFVIFIGALFLTIWALISKFMGFVIPGWTSTVLPLYLFGGIQLMFLGIIGEYIGKIYMEVKKRPSYIVKEMYNFEKKPDL